MANGPNLDEVESSLLSHTAKDGDTQLLMKGVLVMIQNQKSLPCKEHKAALEGHDAQIYSLKKIVWKWMGAIGAIGTIVGLAVAFL